MLPVGIISFRYLVQLTDRVFVFQLKVQLFFAID
jgi:hypothetical protein